MTYTGPALTRPQVKALRSIADRGDLNEVHPARAQALYDRGLIDMPAVQGTRKTAWLTDTGKQLLDDHTPGGAA